MQTLQWPHSPHPLLVPYIVILVKCSILFIDGISHTGHGITHYNRNISFIIASSI